MLKQSDTLKSTGTPNRFYSAEWLMEQLKQHQSLETLLNLMEENFEDTLTSLAVDSPVRTLVLQEMEKAWKDSEAVYSSKLSASQKKFDRLLSSLKMSQPLELEDWNKLSKHLPKSGMTVGGRCLLPQALEPTTKGKDGSCWPTPNTMDSLPPRPPEAMAKTTEKNRKGRTNPANLREAVNIEIYRDTFPKAQYPTPAAMDWKDNGKSPSELARNSTTLATKAGGYLNPEWVEWLMGYKIGHTELNALVTPLYRYKSKRRLKG